MLRLIFCFVLFLFWPQQFDEFFLAFVFKQNLPLQNQNKLIDLHKKTIEFQNKHDLIFLFSNFDRFLILTLQKIADIKSNNNKSPLKNRLDNKFF